MPRSRIACGTCGRVTAWSQKVRSTFHRPAGPAYVEVAPGHQAGPGTADQIGRPEGGERRRQLEMSQYVVSFGLERLGAG
jgi:hypothetical protein